MADGAVRDPPHDPAGRRSRWRSCSPRSSAPWPQTSPHLHNTLLRFAQYFLVGFLLADRWSWAGWPRVAGAGLGRAALATVPVVVMLHTGTGAARWLPTASHQLAAELSLPWLLLLAVIGVFRGVVLNAFLTLPLVTTIGGGCYSIYLLHNVVLNNTLFLTKDLAPTGSYAADLLLQALAHGGAGPRRLGGVLRPRRATVHGPGLAPAPRDLGPGRSGLRKPGGAAARRPGGRR